MQNVKKLVLLLVCALTVIGLIAVQALAETTIIDSGTYGEDLTWTIDSNYRLTISGTGDMQQTYIDDISMDFPWETYRFEVTSVVIEEGVTSIADKAFTYFWYMTEICIPESVSYIGHDAFQNCPALKSVIIPEGVEKIKEFAFYGCVELTSVSFPQSLTAIDRFAFFQCDALSDIQLPDGLISIGTNAFSRCESLKEINIPDTVTSIGSDAFCLSAITSIVIPEGVTCIEDRTFWQCRGLTSITLPSSVTSIGLRAFADCNSLTAVTIPDSVKEIGVHAFYNCGSLKTVVFQGNAPEVAFSEDDESVNTVFDITTANVYYPGGDESWNGQIREDFGGNLTWIPYRPGSFVDVEMDSWYEPAVLWALEKGITTGKDVNRFAPTEACTRAHVMTFLWRAAGKPEPQSMENPFPDVADGKYFTKAVLWAAEQGVTGGYKDGTFRPNSTCTRDQIVTFLWRYMGQPETTSMENTFPDVAEGKFYTEAVLWAAQEGITGGYKDGTFRPSSTCTRDQIVTFLYRAIVE